MPALTPTKAASWRSGGPQTTAYLWLYTPVAKFKARVDMPVSVYPAQSVFFDSVTLGTSAELIYGRTIWIGTSEGANDLGQFCVLGYVGNEIYINRYSRGNDLGTLDTVDNAYITVFDDYRVWSLAPYINAAGQQFKGNQGYSFNYSIRPKAVSNVPAYAKYPDIGTSVQPIAFNALASYSPQGYGLNYAWDFGDGLPATSFSAFETVSFPIGFRWVKLTVSDFNGQSDTQYIPVLVASDSLAIATPFKLWDGTLTSGQTGQALEVSIYGEIDKKDYPDGTLALMWDDETYNDGAKSLAYTSGLEHMRFYGWHDQTNWQTTADQDGQDLQTRMRFVDLATRLTQLPAFPQVLQFSMLPTNWSETSNIFAMLDFYTLYIMREHSTAGLLCSFYPSGETDYQFSALATQGNTLWGQMEFCVNAQAGLFRLVADRYGAIRIKPYPMLQTVGSRTTTNIVTLTEDDISSISTGYDVLPNTRSMQGSALTSSYLTSQALFCVASGERPSQGAQDVTLPAVIALSQAQLNSVTGNAYAASLRPLVYNIGLIYTGDAGLDPALFEWVTLTIDPSIDLGFRGDTIFNKRCLVTQAVTTYDGQTGQIERRYTLLQETSGYDAQTLILDEGTAAPYAPPYSVFGNALPPSNGFGGGAFDNLFAVAQTTVMRTTNFSANSPTWVTDTLSDYGFAPSVPHFGNDFNGIASFVQNPYNANEGWAAARDGIYKITGLTTGVTSCVLQHTFASTLGTRRDSSQFFGACVKAELDAIFNGSTLLACAVTYQGSNGGGNDITCCVSTDGTNWTEYTIDTTVISTTISCYIPSSANNVIYVCGNGRLWRSNNAGVTWSLISSWPLSVMFSTVTNFPFNDPNTVYHTFLNNFVFTDVRVRINTNGIMSNLSNQTLLPTNNTLVGRRSISFCPNAPQNAAMVLWQSGMQEASFDINLNNGFIYVTNDNFASFRVISNPAINPLNNPLGVAMMANPNQIYAWGLANGMAGFGGIRYSDNMGATWQVKLTNITVIAIGGW